MLSALSSSNALLNNAAAVGSWVGDWQPVNGFSSVPVALPIAADASTGTALMFYSASQWTTGSYSTTPNNNPQINGAIVDTAIIYHPVLDQNVLVWVYGGNASNGPNQKAFVWEGSSTRTFSTLTNSPGGARNVAAFDNRLFFGAAADSLASQYPQRVTWSERGNPEVYTEPTGGFEDLLDARGSIQKLWPMDDRILVFFENEIWQGLKTGFPFDFTFVPFDRGVGTIAPMSVADTPQGVVFVGPDLQVYLIPNGSTPVPIGQNIQGLLRDELVNPGRISGVYCEAWNAYVFTYDNAPQASTNDKKAFAISLDHGKPDVSPIHFLANVHRLGTWASDYSTRVLAIDSRGTVSELRPSQTSELRQTLTSRFVTAIDNSNPLTKQFVRELRFESRQLSASSFTVRLSTDLGNTYGAELGIALPALSNATVGGSAQTVVNPGLSAVYPTIELSHSGGHNFVLYGATAILEQVGYG